ncbi:MAG: hypothetical protein GQ540_04130 [Lutibacter sp.]|uniref:hypothetical protein n=1 Tax=Lutibacter sp. TaxID=1925666 RepID=UPI0019DDBEE1|nr:hypothetical protein [Lutibacter sp.]NOR27702.1 hypothetical protein [Lutibacter sp.]
MIANFFNKTKPVNIINVVVLLFLFYVVSFFVEHTIEFSWGFLLNKTIYFFWLLLFILIFKFIIKKNKLTKDNAYALLIAVLILVAFPKAIFSSSVLFSNLILLLSFRKIYSLKSGIHIKIKLYDAAFWIGIATLINSWSVLFIFLIYVGIIVYQKISLKTLLIPIIGLATPIFIYFTYHFYFATLPVFYNKFNFEISLNYASYLAFKQLLPIALLILILTWSIVISTPKIVLVSNHLKFSWNILINHLIIAIIIIALSPIKNGAEFFYLIFPTAIIIANFIQNIKSTILKNVILYLFLGLSVSIYFL